MIRIARGKLNQPDLKYAFLELNQTRVGMDPYYLIERYIDFIDQSNKESFKRTQEIIKKYAKKDENGNPIQKYIITKDAEGKEEKQSVGFDWECEEEVAIKELDALASEEVEIPVRRMYKNDLADIRLTPAQWRAIRDFVVEIDLIPGGKK